MGPFRVVPAECARGKLSVPGDKSIVHRALIVSALADGNTRLENFTSNNDCLSTLRCLKGLGVKIIFRSRDALTISGAGLSGLQKPKGPLFCAESGTTLRLLAGLLAGQGFDSQLTASPALNKRPMSRVNIPLRLMGARITSRVKGKEEYPPLAIRGGELKPLNYSPPVASAQVKSAILLAGLFSRGTTIVHEPVSTRDHTERMLRFFGFPVTTRGKDVVLKAPVRLVSPGLIRVPGDISSAAFFLALGAILPGSELCLSGVSLNPSRLGVLTVLQRMNADLSACKKPGGFSRFEPSGDIVVKSSSLKGTLIKKEEIPSLIDEIPILMVAACFAKGTTVFQGAGELRVKETDRIISMSRNLKQMGASIKIRKSRSGEDILIKGSGALKGARVKSFGDHRTAMSLVIAGLCARGPTTLDDVGCIAKSFPGFLEAVSSVVK